MTVAWHSQALEEALAPSRPVIPPRGWGLKAAVMALASAMIAVLLVLFFDRYSNYAVTPPIKEVPQKPTPPKVDWPPPEGWTPEAAEIIKDNRGRHYYKRLVHHMDGVDLPLVLVGVPRNLPGDPETFYIMENKVWNELFALFMADPESKRLFKKYLERPGFKDLARNEWQKGGFAANKPLFGVDGDDKRKLPVFRATVTEAHCFAEWMGGQLPTQQQWRKAAGWDEGGRVGPFEGDPKDLNGLALGLQEGPWPVDRGTRDVSIYGCRQMASNGYEWTRDLEGPGGKTIPLDQITLAPFVILEGQSYLTDKPLTSFQDLRARPNSTRCTEAKSDISFRIVLEP
jgi:hypothetical protein